MVTERAKRGARLLAGPSHADGYLEDWRARGGGRLAVSEEEGERFWSIGAALLPSEQWGVVALVVVSRGRQTSQLFFFFKYFHII
jgi:hypothetical protein